MSVRVKWRHTVVVLLLAGMLLAGPLTGWAVAQEPSRNELLLGGGFMAGEPASVPVFDVGYVRWADRWGVAMRYGAAIGADVDDAIGRHPNAERVYLGVASLHYVAVTARRRFGSGAVEYNAGVGLTVYRQNSLFVRREADTLEVHNWSGGEPANTFTLEFLVGRRLSRHLGVKAGVMQNFHVDEGSNTQLVGYAAIKF